MILAYHFRCFQYTFGVFMKKYSIEMDVRDNELDAQGIVNNANYMIYLSHSRHKHVHELGIDFNEYNKLNQKLVVLSCTMKFKNSLRANDVFIVTSSIGKSEYPNQWTYNQTIKNKLDNKVIMNAIFTSTCINENTDNPEEKLYIPEIIRSIIES